MHYKELFNKQYYNNQEIFNKKLNWFFDIKNCIYSESKKYKIRNDANQIIEEYKSLKNRNIKKKNIIIKTKKINLKKFLKKNNQIFNKQILNSLDFLMKNKLEKFFKHFLIQGSFATKDYVEGWSDFDTFVVLKKEIFSDSNNLIKLRNILKKFYKFIIKFSHFQHHGLIIYTEYDLQNYKHGFLPKEAINKKSLSLFDTTNILIKKQVAKKRSLSKKILLERLNYIKKGIKNGYYDHHVVGNKKLTIPIQKNEKTLKQLFAQISFILNIPILVLDSLNKSSHKKESFRKFYKITKNTKINNFIKKHEFLRKNWKDYSYGKDYINANLKRYLGKNYFNECLDAINFCLKNLVR